MDPRTLVRSTINRRFLLTAWLGDWQFEAEDTTGRRPARLTLMPPESPEARHLGAPEIEAEGVLQVLATGEVGTGAAAGMLYVATEAHQGTLAVRGTLSQTEAETLVHDVATTLGDLADARQAYGHLNPHTVLWVDGRWKLEASIAHDRTLGGTLLDALERGYVAPDLLAGRVSPAADMWALGCLVQVAVAGRPPYEPQDVVWALACESAPHFERLPGALDLVVRGCLLQDAARRWNPLRVLSVLEDGIAAPDEPRLARSAVRPRTVKAWPARPERRVPSWEGLEDPPVLAGLISARSATCHGTLDGVVVTPAGPFPSQGGAVLSLAESGKTLAWGCFSGLVGVRGAGWNAPAPVLGVAVHGDRVVCACADRTLNLLTLPDLTRTHVMDVAARGVAFSADGREVAVRLADGSQRVYPVV